MLNQDPWWRSRVLPLFIFDPENPGRRPIGLGTAFRVDPFGGAATAFHVIEDLLVANRGRLDLASTPSVVALDTPEGAYLIGQVPIPREWWRPLNTLVAYPIGIKTSPLYNEPERVQNFSELAALGFSPLVYNAAPYLRVRLRKSMPAVGDILTAYGYADLDQGGVENDPMRLYLHSYSGPVVEITPGDPASTRPWPKIVVDVRWPSGMSGGPVVNEDTDVIGIVSTSFDGSECSTAHAFAGWNVPEMIFPGLDPNNPGWFYGFAAVDDNGMLKFFGRDPVQIKEFAASHGYRALAVSLEHTTGNWIEANDPDGPYPPSALI